MMPWSDEQQRLLRAMGYVLYARMPVPVSAGSPTATAADLSTADTGRLLGSLRLAALGRDVSALIADLGALRGDARAKRALWPKLRALRRAGSTSGAAGRMPKGPDVT